MSATNEPWFPEDDGADQEISGTCLPTISKGPVSPAFAAPVGIDSEPDDDDDTGESLWQTDDEPVTIAAPLPESDEVGDLPDPDTLFLCMQEQLSDSSLLSEPVPDDDLADPDALFLQMQKLGDSGLDSGDFPDAQALFLQMRAETDPHDNLPDPNELYLRLRAMEAAPDEGEELPDPDALFQQMQYERSGHALGERYDDQELPDPDELFLRFRTLEMESEQPQVESLKAEMLEVEESEELPDADELFQQMQRGALLPVSDQQDELPDPSALFLQLQEQEVESSTDFDSEVLPDPSALFLQLQEQEVESSTDFDSEVLPDPSALFLQLQAHQLGEEVSQDPTPLLGSLGLGHSRVAPLSEEEEDWFKPLPRTTSPHSGDDPEVEKLGLFGRLKAKFSKKIEAVDPSPFRADEESDLGTTLPDPGELFRRMRAEQDDEFPLEVAREPSSALPDPDELFRRMEEEELGAPDPIFSNSKSAEELPALPDLDAFRAELEAEEMSKLDADLLGDLSGPERFADTVSDLAFNAGTFFDAAPTMGSLHKKSAHRQSKTPSEKPIQEPPVPAMLGGPDLRPARSTPELESRDTIRVPLPPSKESEPTEAPVYLPTVARKPTKSKRSTTEVARTRAAAPVATVGMLERIRTAWRRPTKIGRHGLSIFTRQLAAMLKAGIALHQCISFCAVADPEAEPILTEVVKKIESGYTLSGALNEYPESFDPVYIGLVHSGELSGRLAEMLARLADILEREIEMRKRMISVVTYPAVLLAVSMLGTLGFIFFVLPQLTPLFTDLKVELPWPTQVLLGLREVLLPLAIVGVSSAVIAWLSKARLAAFIKERPILQRRLAAFPLTIPVIGPVYEKLITARVLYAMATMLEVGVTMSQALARAENTSGNAFIGYRLSRARADLADGASVTECFQVNQVFPETAMQLIAAGEESARIVEMFSYVARHFDDDVSHSMDAAASMLEPLIMVGMGCVVGFIVIASAMPTIQLLQNFG